MSERKRYSAPAVRVELHVYRMGASHLSYAINVRSSGGGGQRTKMLERGVLPSAPGEASHDEPLGALAAALFHAFAQRGLPAPAGSGAPQGPTGVVSHSQDLAAE